MTLSLLTRLQQNFADGLLDVDKVDMNLPGFKTRPETAGLIRDRFGLYRGNIQAIWRQTLANAFPVLEQLVGEDFFGDLARAFGVAQPSQSGNLAEFGVHLPDFIRSLDNLKTYPYLSDVAALEWQLHRAYYAPQLAPSLLHQLEAFTPEKLPLVRFTLQPGCALLQSAWDSPGIWLAHQERGEPLQPLTFPQQLDRATWALVWRDGWQVRMCPISRAAFAALQALVQGEHLGAALNAGLEAAQAGDDEFVIATELRGWFERELICAIDE